MTLYLDSSVVVSAITAEPRTVRARDLLAGDEPAVASLWTLVEAASALSIKVRTRAITASEQEVALRTLAALERTHLRLLTITDAHMRTAVSYTGRPELNLRGGDALHLAVAGSEGLTLVTGDGPMSRAAEQLGVAVRLL